MFHANASVKVLIHHLASGINVKEDPVRWKVLSEDIPIVYKLLASTSNTDVPQPFVNILLDLWKKGEMVCREISQSMMNKHRARRRV